MSCKLRTRLLNRFGSWGTVSDVPSHLCALVQNVGGTGRAQRTKPIISPMTTTGTIHDQIVVWALSRRALLRNIRGRLRRLDVDDLSSANRPTAGGRSTPAHGDVVHRARVRRIRDVHRSRDDAIDRSPSVSGNIPDDWRFHRTDHLDRRTPHGPEAIGIWGIFS